MKKLVLVAMTATLPYFISPADAQTPADKTGISFFDIGLGESASHVLTHLPTNYFKVFKTSYIAPYIRTEEFTQTILFNGLKPPYSDVGVYFSGHASGNQLVAWTIQFYDDALPPEAQHFAEKIRGILNSELGEPKQKYSVQPGVEWIFWAWRDGEPIMCTDQIECVPSYSIPKTSGHNFPLFLSNQVHDGDGFGFKRNLFPDSLSLFPEKSADVVAFLNIQDGQAHFQVIDIKRLRETSKIDIEDLNKRNVAPPKPQTRTSCVREGMDISLAGVCPGMPRAEAEALLASQFPLRPDIHVGGDVPRLGNVTFQSPRQDRKWDASTQYTSFLPQTRPDGSVAFLESGKTTIHYSGHPTGQIVTAVEESLSYDNAEFKLREDAPFTQQMRNALVKKFGQPRNKHLTIAWGDGPNDLQWTLRHGKNAECPYDNSNKFQRGKDLFNYNLCVGPEDGDTWWTRVSDIGYDLYVRAQMHAMPGQDRISNVDIFVRDVNLAIKSRLLDLDAIRAEDEKANTPPATPKL